MPTLIALLTNFLINIKGRYSYNKKKIYDQWNFFKIFFFVKTDFLLKNLNCLDFFICLHKFVNNPIENKIVKTAIEDTGSIYTNCMALC